MWGGRPDCRALLFGPVRSARLQCLWASCPNWQNLLQHVQASNCRSLHTHSNPAVGPGAGVKCFAVLLCIVVTHLTPLHAVLQAALLEAQTAAASLLARYMAQPLHGPRVVLLVQRMLPPGLVASLQVS